MLNKFVTFAKVEKRSEANRKSRAYVWKIARVTNMVISFGYLILIGVSLLITTRIYYYGGRTLLNSFDIDDRKMTILVPFWYHIADNLDFGDWLTVPVVMTILMCNVWLLNFAVSFDLLLWGKSTFACLLAIILVLCTMALEGGVFYNIHGLDSTIMFNIRVKMQALIQKEYKVMGCNDLTVALNMMMIKGDCCGFSGPHDFRNVGLRIVLKKNQSPYKEVRYYDDSPFWLRQFTVPDENIEYDGNFKIPPACCNDDVSNVNDTVTRFYRVVDCATSESFNMKHNVQGCLGHFYESAFPVHVRLITISLIMFFQTIQIILIMMIMITLPLPLLPFLYGEEGGEEEEGEEEEFEEDFEDDKGISDDLTSFKGTRPGMGDEDEGNEDDDDEEDI